MLVELCFCGAWGGANAGARCEVSTAPVFAAPYLRYGGRGESLIDRLVSDERAQFDMFLETVRNNAVDGYGLLEGASTVECAWLRVGNGKYSVRCRHSVAHCAAIEIRQEYWNHQTFDSQVGASA